MPDQMLLRGKSRFQLVYYVGFGTQEGAPGCQFCDAGRYTSGFVVVYRAGEI
jgi:hypothetical protein